MVRFIHTADWQLGVTRHYLSPEAQARFSAARLGAVRAMGRLAVETGCAFIVVCGDVFESNFVERQVLSRALDALGEIPVPIYLLPGNHDPLDAASLYRSPAFARLRPANVFVLDSYESVEAAAGVRLYPAPWASKRPLEDLVARAAASIDDGDAAVRVIVGHGIVDRLSPDPDNPAQIAVAPLEDMAARGVVHYVALGDRHSRTRIGSGERIWYSGTQETTGFDEEAPGDVLLVEIGDEPAGEITVTPHRVGTWRFVRKHAALDGSGDVEALAEWLESLDTKDRTILRLSLEGSLRVRDKARLDVLVDELGDLFASLEISERRSDLAVIPDDADFGDLGLTGFAANALEDLRVQAGNPGEEGRVAQDALALLYRLCRKDDR